MLTLVEVVVIGIDEVEVATLHRDVVLVGGEGGVGERAGVGGDVGAGAPLLRHEGAFAARRVKGAVASCGFMAGLGAARFM